MNSSRKLKRAVIKEELVALTEDMESAVILNQFLYWIERRKDFDLFIEEEKSRDPSTKIALTNGWIYKSAAELKEETMLSLSETTIRRRITHLVEQGWLEERHNPDHAWDRMLQYRPNICKLQSDLSLLGYPLEGYSFCRIDTSSQNGECILQGEESILQNGDSILQGEGALPEITTEITTENKTNGADAPTLPGFDTQIREDSVPTGKEETISSASVDYQVIRQRWSELFPDKPQPRAVSKTLQSKAKTRMKEEHFRDNWEAAMERASHSQLCNSGGWFDLGWFLKNDDNYVKCLDGKYDGWATANAPPKKRSTETRTITSIDPFTGETRIVEARV